METNKFINLTFFNSIDESQTKEVVLSEEQLQGTYDVTLQHILSDDSKDAAISCQLSIPGTNYTKRREKMYHGEYIIIFTLINRSFIKFSSNLQERLSEQTYQPCRRFSSHWPQQYSPARLDCNAKKRRSVEPVFDEIEE